MKTGLFVVDRVENDILILCKIDEEICICTSINSCRDKLSDGDIVRVLFDDNGAVVDVVPDKNETLLRRKEINKNLKSLFDN